jgi:benzoyl-CoA 2,3-dioxygenase component B
MLREEAHHMFVGASGIGRVVQRTAELMQRHDTDDVRPFGGIDVATLQRYLNFHYSVSLDLFGAETSTNAANYFAAGLKGRFHEGERDDDHRLHDATVAVPTLDGTTVGSMPVPALSALNETLRQDFIADCARGVERWNRSLAPVGAALELPHVGFHRQVGAFAGQPLTPGGTVVTTDVWAAGAADWLPTDADRTFVASLMTAVTDRGKMASWIAPPSAGIHGRPIEFEYVRTD